MRILASHVAVFVIGVILATSAGAVAHTPKPRNLAVRLNQLEVRHEALQANYQTFCNTLRHANTADIQDVQVRAMFTRLANTCWIP